MVYVTHDGDNRSARLKIFFLVFRLGHSILYLGTDIFGLEAKLLGHDVDGLGIEALVDAHHDTNAHAGADDLRHGYVHHCGQFVCRHKFRQLEHLAFGIHFATLLFLGSTHLLALFLAVFCALGRLWLGGEACQRFAYLLCYVFVADFHLHFLGFLLAFLAS